MEEIKKEFLSRGYRLLEEFVDGSIWGFSCENEKYGVMVMSTGYELIVSAKRGEETYTSMGSIFDYEHVMGLIEKSLG